MYQYLNIGTTNIWLYAFFGTIGTYVLILFNLLQYRQKKEFLSLYSQSVLSYVDKKVPRMKFLAGILLTLLELRIISYVQYNVPATFNRPFGDLVGTAANYFGLLFPAPFILLLFCILMRIEPLKQIDLITPAYPLALVFAKIACFCAGCCRGIECSFGLYNHSVESGLVEFPVQLVEAGLALAIFIFLMYWRKKAKPGTMFPTYLILFSGTRFFSEFLRCEPEVFWIFKTYHILCIIGVIVGVAELFLVLKFGDKISQFDILRLFAKPLGKVKMFLEEKVVNKFKKWKEKQRKKAKKRKRKSVQKDKKQFEHHHNKSHKKRRSKKH